MVGKHDSVWPFKVNPSRNSAYRTEKLTKNTSKNKTRNTRLNFPSAADNREPQKAQQAKKPTKRNPVQPDHRFKNIPCHEARCLRTSELSRFQKSVMSQHGKNFTAGPTDRAEVILNIAILSKLNLASAGYLQVLPSHIILSLKKINKK